MGEELSLIDATVELALRTLQRRSAGLGHDLQASRGTI